MSAPTNMGEVYRNWQARLTRLPQPHQMWRARVGAEETLRVVIIEAVENDAIELTTVAGDRIVSRNWYSRDRVRLLTLMNDTQEQGNG